MPAEFSDPKFPSYGEGREVVRAVSGGLVNIQMNLLTRDMEQFGYQVILYCLFIHMFILTDMPLSEHNQTPINQLIC